MKRKLPLAITAALTLPALAAVLPFTEAFESGLGEFTVEDTNNDGVTVKTASYSGVNNSSCIQYPGSADNAADDWLFTPAFNLKKGYVYTLTYQYKVRSSNTTHKVEWKAGTTAASAGMSLEIDSEKDFTYNFNSWEKESVTFTVPEDGEYYLGMHLLSEAAQGIIYFDNIEISDGLNVLAPMSPEVADAKFSIKDDALNTSFDITLPTQTNGGETIDPDTEIEVIVGREEDENIGSVKGMPGEVVTFTDSDAPLTWTTYRFHCVVGDAESPKVEVDAIPRFGNPKAVENFSIEQNGNEFTLSWDAVTEAVNASDLFNPAQVKYLVKCNGETVADNTSELTATYTCPMPEDGQEPVSFTIVAISSGLQSGVVTSDSYMVGDPYTGEFKESFAGRTFSNKTWVIENNKGWSISTGSFSPSVNPQDSDGGCLEFALNGTAKIWSPVLNLSTLQNPKVKFYAYLYPSSYYETTIQPGFMVNGEEIVVGEPISLKSGTEGWTEFIIDVPAEAQENNCQLMFTGTGTYAYSGKFYIDNISIVSYLDHNLAVEVSSPVKSLEIGQEVTFPITIENKGANAENDYTLTLFADGEKVAEAQGPEVEPMGNASAELSFKALPKYAGQEIEFTVALTLDGDGDEEDNEAELSIPVNGNDLERVQSVNATLATDASKVTLEWTAPEVSTEPTYAEVTESFEDWESWSIEGANGWLFVDVDEAEQKGINDHHAKEKYSAMIAENFSTYSDNLTSYDGIKSIVIGVNYNYGGNVDNWVISPEVKGGTTVSFQTKVLSSYTATEGFSVLWSEGGTSPEDFKELEEFYSLNSSWVEKSFELPAKATRFAIRMSDSHYYPIAFDAFTFTATSSPAVHTGFNVYRDHELLAAYPAETLTHVDNAPVLGNEHVYHVTALYDKGESHYSEPMNVKVELETGIGEIEVSADDAEFFTLQGLRIERPAAGEIVIVRKGDKTFKAVVR
ncbi:MAG: choice-of-anchor J domain-containing protein [Muribaculaceae bacterium]|nr:choice-of-anchor J domain-containing protein [Muribaculaceae bacterium]